MPPLALCVVNLVLWPEVDSERIYGPDDGRPHEARMQASGPPGHQSSPVQLTQSLLRGLKACHRQIIVYITICVK